VSGAEFAQTPSYLEVIQTRSSYYRVKYTVKQDDQELRHLERDHRTLHEHFSDKEEQMSNMDLDILDLKTDLQHTETRIQELENLVEEYQRKVAALEGGVAESRDPDRKRARKLPPSQPLVALERPPAVFHKECTSYPSFSRSARIDEDIDMFPALPGPSSYAAQASKPVTSEEKPHKTNRMVYWTPSSKDAKRNIALGIPPPKGKPGSLNFGKIKKIFALANEPGNVEVLAQAKELVALVQKTPAAERTHVMKYAINEWRVPTWASKKNSASIATGLFTEAEVTAAERQVNEAVTAQAVVIALLAIAEPSRDGTADEYLQWYASTPSAERWGLTHTALAIADFRAIKTCKCLTPLPSEKGKEGPGLRSAWTRNYISLIAIPNYYRDLCHAHRWVISPTQSFN
jgi:hypothetical protein